MERSAGETTAPGRTWELPAWLVILEGESEGVRFELEPATTVGRDPENTICLLDERTSRHHAVVRRSDGAWTLHDLGSANGIWVGDERRDKPWRLSDGDTFRIGNTTFRFDWDGEPDAKRASLELTDRSSIEIVPSAQGSVELGDAHGEEAVSAGAAAATLGARRFLSCF